MTAVSDTSPICYLILIDEISILPRLFSDVLVPPAVVAELRHEDAPEIVRKWSFSLPSWIAVKDGSVAATTGMENLQTGEQAAILLAQSANANVILLDEKSARRVAADRYDDSAAGFFLFIVLCPASQFDPSWSVAKK